MKEKVREGVWEGVTEGVRDGETYTSLFLSAGLNQDQEDEAASLMMKLSEANEEAQRVRRINTQVGREGGRIHITV